MSSEQGVTQAKESWPALPSVHLPTAEAPRKLCAAFEVHRMSHGGISAFADFKAGLIPVFFEVAGFWARTTLGLSVNPAKCPSCVYPHTVHNEQEEVSL